MLHTFLKHGKINANMINSKEIEKMINKFHFEMLDLLLAYDKIDITFLDAFQNLERSESGVLNVMLLNNKMDASIMPLNKYKKRIKKILLKLQNIYNSKDKNNSDVISLEDLHYICNNKYIHIWPTLIQYGLLSQEMLNETVWCSLCVCVRVVCNSFVVCNLLLLALCDL